MKLKSRAQETEYWWLFNIRTALWVLEDLMAWRTLAGKGGGVAGRGSFGFG